MPACKLLLVWCSLIFLPGALAAQNLVPNPSFTDINICTEYTSPCEAAAWWRVAPHIRRVTAVFNPQGVNNGDSYIQLESNQGFRQRREYLQTRLLAPLKAGKKYKVVVYAGSRHDYADGIDLLFRTQDIYSMFARFIDVQPSIRLREKHEVKHIKSWHVYETVYVPDSNYTNLVLGDFSPERRLKDDEEPLYFWVDSIAVTPLEDTEKLDNRRAKNVYGERHRHTLPDAYLRSQGMDLIKMATAPVVDTMLRHKREEFFRLLEAGGPKAPDATINRKLLELMQLQQTSSHCDTIILGSGLFTEKGAEINDKYAFVLDSALRYYQSGQPGKIKVIGYINRPGTDHYNELLSHDRAQTVVKYLVYRAGFTYDDFETHGMGRQSPRYDTLTGKGREGNDRIEIIVCTPPQMITLVPPSPPKADTLVIPDVLFKHNSAALEPRFLAKLDTLIRKIPKEKVELQVIGHTDNNGTDAYNEDLSRRRASTVATFMGMKGYADKVRYIAGEGEKRPVATNTTSEGRQQNRRVEIIIHKVVD
ncbi:OmpA family protein [Chitinophaga horti]|uniref:OmpA family protein n=1 Tax=Chitinophaga horti TaxID=2920382 RepID=A0ABY6IYY4_9BACT|nr:OmpA family protein [Chitinophaga horti]UYQ92603.1 OmpA family protein [Chitinophaga horti]